MPYSYTIHRHPDLHHIRYSGHVSMQDIRSVFTVSMKDPARFPGMPALVDLTAMTGTDAGFVEMVSLRDSLPQAYAGSQGPILIAMLAPSDSPFGMARMFQMLVGEIEGVDVRIFATLPPALDMLSLAGTPTAHKVAGEIASGAAIPEP